MRTDDTVIDVQLAARKEARLNQILLSTGSALIAFSGGVDSSFLLFKAVRLLGNENVIAVTAASILRPSEEMEQSRLIAGNLKVRHIIVETDELGLEKIHANPPQRCYYCKKELYEKMVALARKYGSKTVMDGTITEDEEEYRPGLKATAETGVESPLKEARLTKEEIRYLSRKYGLVTWNKPTTTCLATRFPYGEKLDREKLMRVAAAEQVLRKMGIAGTLRVRSHGKLARIEIGQTEIPGLLEKRKELVSKLKDLGFDYVTLDLEGFRSGSMDMHIADNKG
ncbi:MAG: ATP-dependent sacrificial sulfur transferase LarE [Firmicutes bacterium]|jgi:uncharacterized protein|nr:ATP-dependent sacrificial sulfur transferase LarE [Bacillota bacterium]